MASSKLKVYKSFLALSPEAQADVLEFIKDVTPKKQRRARKAKSTTQPELTPATAAVKPARKPRAPKRAPVIVPKEPVVPVQYDSEGDGDETGDGQ